ncbi:Isochorismatase-like protein [Pilaira anomala]|nr:Isochorismatase-like protein [Pilaira anomala]
MTEALIVVDVQNDYFPDGKLPTWKPVETAEAIAKLIKKFRGDGKEVIFIKHIMKKKQEEKFPFFIRGSYGTEIHDIVKPLPNEKIFEKEEVSAFHRTDLKDYLSSTGITHLMVVGMMIHNCVNATVYSAVEAGFPSLVVDECVNTMDQPLYGEIVKAEEIKKAFLTGIQFVFSTVHKLEDVLKGKYEYTFF